MALPTTKTDVINIAFRRIGHQGVTAAQITANTATDAVHANLHYELDRDALQRSFWWRFNKARIRLASAWATAKAYTTDQYVLNNSVWYKCKAAHTSGTLDDEPGTGAVAGTYWTTLTTAQVTPDFEYTYKFSLPADYLCKRYVWEDNAAQRTIYSYSIEGSLFLTDDATVDLVYSKQVTDVTAFDALYTKVLSLTLAKDFATAIAKDAKLEKEIRDELGPLMSKVRALDRQEQHTKGRADYYTHNDARSSYDGRIPSQMGS